MAEKGSGNGKKDQQKNKKSGKNEKNNQDSKKVQNDKNHDSKKVQNDKNHDSKKFQNDKKKVHANGLKANAKISAPAPKKKKTAKKVTAKGKSDSFLSQLIRLFIIQAGILWVLYIVDYQKFTQLRTGAMYIFNSTVNVLPPDVVAKGRETFEYVRAPTEVVLNQVATVANATSTFLNTNPLVKDHWAIVRDISYIFSARLADYMRTVYVQLTGYIVDVKNKILP